MNARIAGLILMILVIAGCVSPTGIASQSGATADRSASAPASMSEVPSPTSSVQPPLPVDPSIEPISIKDHSPAAEAAFQACNVAQLGLETVAGMGLLSSPADLPRYAPFAGTEPQLKLTGPVWLIQFKGALPMPKSSEWWIDPVCIKMEGESGYFAVNGVKTMPGGKFLPPLAPQTAPTFSLPPLLP